MTKAAQRKTEYYSKKTGNNRNAHVVLVELCHQMDSLSINSEEDEVDVQMSTESRDSTDSDLFADLESFVDIPDELLEPEVAENEMEIHIIEGPSDVYVSVEQLDVFQGACLDTGAERSVICLSQAEAYYRCMGIPLILKRIAPKA